LPSFPTRRSSDLGGFGVPGSRGFIPGAIDAAKLYIGCARVKTSKVEPQLGAVDGRIGRQRGQIELHKCQMSVRCANPDETIAKALVWTAALETHILRGSQIYGHRLLKRRGLDMTCRQQGPCQQEEDDGFDRHPGV